MRKKRVLFVCVHNAARSQMAEAWLNRLGQEEFEVESAGYLPTAINPLVVDVMAEEGFDLSGNAAKSIFEKYKSYKSYEYIVTVCSKAREENCPAFPGVKEHIHWDLEDPETFEGSEDQKMEKLRAQRDRIRGLVLTFVSDKHEPA